MMAYQNFITVEAAMRVIRRILTQVRKEENLSVDIVPELEQALLDESHSPIEADGARALISLDAEGLKNMRPGLDDQQIKVLLNQDWSCLGESSMRDSFESQIGDRADQLFPSDEDYLQIPADVSEQALRLLRIMVQSLNVPGGRTWWEIGRLSKTSQDYTRELIQHRLCVLNLGGERAKASSEGVDFWLRRQKEISLKKKI